LSAKTFQNQLFFKYFQSSSLKKLLGGNIWKDSESGSNWILLLGMRSKKYRGRYHSAHAREEWERASRIEIAVAG